jgi:hypothetical protein
MWTRIRCDDWGDLAGRNMMIEREGRGRSEVPCRGATPSAPSREAIWSLQRSAGNRAVAGVLLARARVTTGKKFREQVPQRPPGGTRRERRLRTLEQEIHDRLVRYNRAAAPTVADQVSLLGELDERIYEWFSVLGSTDFDTEPRALFMRRLMEKLDAEHVNVVTRAIGQGVAPIYQEGLSPEARRRATRLWNSIRQNAGMIKIAPGGDPLFRAKTLSSIAKMLHTRIGRDVLAFLNAAHAPGGAPPGVVGAGLPGGVTGWETYVAPDRAALQGAGFQTAGLTDTESGNRPLSQVHGSGAGAQSYTKLAAPPANLANYPVVADAQEYNRALLAGKSGFAIDTDAGTEYYKFGTGEGNLVVMKYGQFARGMGAGGVEVISPDFVLLAHEFGHAVRVRGGGHAGREKQFRWFGEASATWANRPEEMSNVLGIENVVRGQSGITERSTYNTWKYVHGEPRMGQLSTQLDVSLHLLRNFGFTADDVWAWAETVPAARTLFMIAAPAQAKGVFSKAERDEIAQIRNEISSRVLAQAGRAEATFFEDFLATEPTTVAAHLLPLLREISEDAAKARALMVGLTATEKGLALRYLFEEKRQVGSLDHVKSLLHFKQGARRGTTATGRAAARLEALQSLIAGGTLTAAMTARTTAAATD